MANLSPPVSHPNKPLVQSDMLFCRKRSRDPGQEAVATARNRFYEARILGRAAQGFAQAADGIVQTVFEIDERILWPEPLLKLLPGDHLPWMLKESKQDLQWLLVEFNTDAMLAQLAGFAAHFECAEAFGWELRMAGHPALTSICGEPQNSSATTLLWQEHSLNSKE